jgi:hypothetical protein
MLTVGSLLQSANLFRGDGDGETVSARYREKALAEKKEVADEKPREQEARVEVKERSSRMLTVDSLSRSANSFRSDGDTVSARKREEALAEKKERSDGDTVSARKREEALAEKKERADEQ